MRSTREVETKLAVDDGFVVPRLAEVKGTHRTAVRTLRLRATHYDTDDLRLARTGTTLRHRTGEGRPCWTLKVGAVTAGGLDREELTVAGPGTSVPAALQDLLTSQLRGAGLHPVVQLRTLRTSTLLYDDQGRELAEVVDDQVEVVRSGEPAGGWREVEVEQRAGASKVASRVVRLLTDAGARVGDQTPKAVRALGPAAALPPDLPPLPRVRHGQPVGALVRWSLASGYRQLLAHDLGVRRGLDDEVHQLRVTCRRLRSDLRTYRSLVDDPRVGVLREELRWLGGSFGAARDLEVLREDVRARAAEDPLAPLDATTVDVLLAAREDVALQHALEALRSARYLVLLQLLHDVAAEPGLSPKAGGSCDEVLPRLVRRAARRLDDQARALTAEDPDGTWHRARILAKRARYAAEWAQVALGKQVAPQVERAKRAQTLLGEHQDAAMAATRLLALADEHPEEHALGVLCGRLAERERARVRAVRTAFLAERG
jgi:inorganic triphosphatase YgiF